MNLANTALLVYCGLHQAMFLFLVLTNQSCFVIKEGTMEWLRTKAILEDPYHIQIQDFLGEGIQNLDFEDSIVNMSLGFGHLVVTTISQCLVYNIQDWRNPYVIKDKETSIILKQCQNSFLIVDLANELHIFTYEGKKLSSPYFYAEALDCQRTYWLQSTVTTLEVFLKLLDTNTGKELEQVLQHPVPIVEVDMNQQGARSDRILIFIDFHNDLFITSILKPCITKLSSLTTKALWSSEAHIIAAMVDQNLIIWYYPQAVFVDEDLLRVLQIKKESFKGKNAALQDFHATRCTIQYDDGAFVTRSLSPKPFLLFEYIASNEWDRAKKLCWVFKEMSLWASIAAAAIDAKHYDVAEEAYTALDQIDKANFIKHLKSKTSEVVRDSEHALFIGRSGEAEAILLNAGLIYRAIKLNLRLFKWDRALEIALLHKRHVDTVFWKRGEYLLEINQKETKKAFQNLVGQVQIDVEKIKLSILEDKNLEKNLK